MQELHAQYVEDNLLSQVRVVSKEQEINVWVMGKTLIRFRVCKLRPVSIGSLRFICAVSLDPPKSPQLLSTNTELVIAPKSRKTQQEPAQEVTKNEPVTAIVRLLPKSETRTELSKSEGPSLMALVSPHTQRALNMPDGQRVYLQRLSPPVQALLKDIKYLQRTMGESNPKDMALKRLRDEISGKDRQNREIMKGEEAPSFALRSSVAIPPNHIGLLDYPESWAWDIIR